MSLVVAKVSIIMSRTNHKPRTEKKAPNPEVMDMLLNKPCQKFRDKRDRRAKEHKNDWKKESYDD
jgi:hypothetical protein